MYTVGNVHGCGEELVMGYSTTAGTEVRGCAPFHPPTPGRATATAGLCLTCSKYLGTGLFSVGGVIPLGDWHKLDRALLFKLKY